MPGAPDLLISLSAGGPILQRGPFQNSVLAESPLDIQHGALDLFLPRLSAYLLQGGYFLFSVKKSHILAYFKIYIPKRLFPKQLFPKRQFLNCKSSDYF